MTDDTEEEPLPEPIPDTDAAADDAPHEPDADLASISEDAEQPENETVDGDGNGEIPGEDEDDEDGEENEDNESGPELPLASIVEAVLFAAREPLKLQNIARAVGKRTRQEAVKDVIAELNVHYLDTGRAFEIAEISGRYQLMSRPEYVSHIVRIYPKKELVEKDKATRLTPSALDTLSIIAYKQPVTRAEIEHIRGCGCGAVLRALIERGSVKVAGKRMDLVGQPLLYGTTEAFLAEFGLGSIEELPLRNEFLGMLGESAADLADESEEEVRVLELQPVADDEETSDAEAPETPESVDNDEDKGDDATESPGEL